MEGRRKTFTNSKTERELRALLGLKPGGGVFSRKKEGLGGAQKFLPGLKTGHIFLAMWLFSPVIMEPWGLPEEEDAWN